MLFSKPQFTFIVSAKSYIWFFLGRFNVFVQSDIVLFDDGMERG